MYMTFFYFGVIIFVTLVAITFWSTITDLLYAAVKQWKQVALVFLFVLVGLTAGVSNAFFDDQIAAPDVSGYYATLMNQPKEDKVLARINDCKAFVTAKLENEPLADEPSPPIADVVKIGARSYWDTCAHTFGTNYWKYDISINGENGGRVLCRAYHQTPYKSGNVETWCNTVFADEQSS